MKKLVCALLAAGLLSPAASAYTVPNVNTVYEIPFSDPAINNDPQVLAQMLSALGMFRGTDNGFELARIMRRDEAAAMLVRFLGGEEEALAQNAAHPFSDVPAWASPYVGWLYANELTNGISETQYGAAQPVTAWQYATFLTRALTGDDYEQTGLLTQNEEDNGAQQQPLSRGAAVLLSARALTKPCTKDGGTDTLAQTLLAAGAFTQEQFAQAVWNVLPPAYTEEDSAIVCRVAGIAVARSESGLTLVADSDARRDQGALYALREGVLLRLDPQTLQAESLGARVASSMRYVGKLGETDYLLETDGALFAVRGDEVREVLSAETLQAAGFTPTVSTMPEGALLVSASNGVYVLTANAAPRRIDVSGAVSSRAGYLYGEGGLFALVQQESGWSVRRLYEAPVRDVQVVREGAGVSDPYVLVGAGEQTQVLCIGQDGTVSASFAPHTFGLTEVRFAEDADGAPVIEARNGADAGVYSYALAGKLDSLTVLRYRADDSAQQSSADTHISDEQSRVNLLAPALFAERENGVQVMQQITSAHSEIRTQTADGKIIDSVTVAGDALALPEPDAWVLFAPQLQGYDSEYLWGSAGLYRESVGQLTQITALPVYNYARMADGSFVIVTHAPDRFVTYSEQAMTQRTGDTLLRILPDGTAEPLLPELDEGSLLVDTVSVTADGKIRFTLMTPTEPRMMGRYTCELENGKVTVLDATLDIVFMHSGDLQTEIAKEQARLDALGIGAGAS